MKFNQRQIVNWCIVIFMVSILLWGVIEMAPSEETSPCSSARYLRSCYDVERDVCLKLWDSSKAECQQQISKLNLNSGRLISPIMEQCQRSKYDRVFRYVRKHSSECDGEVQKIEAWRQTNPGF